MRRTPRRIDRKVHRRFLLEVAGGVMRMPSWRKRLLELEEGREVPVDAQTVVGENNRAARLIRRWRLHYVLRLDVENEANDPYPVRGAVVFRVTASDYPAEYAWVEELTEALGRSDSEAASLYRANFGAGDDALS